MGKSSPVKKWNGLYTTGEVAKILGISRGSVINYCNEGKMDSEKNPISNFRRISSDTIVEFAEGYGIHINKEEILSLSSRN
jgi:predicted transcriptional regulator